MKKKIAIILAGVLALSVLASCGDDTKTTTAATTVATTTTAAANDGGDSGESTTAATTAEITKAEKTVNLSIITTFAGDDAGTVPYQTAISDWQSKTGNTVSDESQTSNEQFKSMVNTRFSSGSSPDVLFYFNGTDINDIVKAGGVVSLDTIKAAYPEFASNHNWDLIPGAPVDGVKYAVPLYGYWEGMFVNKAVVDAAGAEVPGATTTWEQFYEINDKIKAAGNTPIAVSLAEVPHYWFEFATLAEAGPDGHIPGAGVTEATVGANWAAGLNTIKELFEKGYLPDNTTTNTDGEAWDQMQGGKSAFAIDGSWKANAVAEFSNAADFTVTYVPGKGKRVATDLIGGLSSGFYISKQAWDNPDKQKAAVSLVEYLISDESVSKFPSAGLAVSIKSGSPSPEASAPQIKKDGAAMVSGATTVTAAVEDLITASQRSDLMTVEIPNVAQGKTEAAAAISQVFQIQ